MVLRRGLLFYIHLGPGRVQVLGGRVQGMNDFSDRQSPSLWLLMGLVVLTRLRWFRAGFGVWGSGFYGKRF